MEKLIKELKTQIAAMNKANGSKYNLSDEVLDSLYSVYPSSCQYPDFKFHKIWNEEYNSFT